MLSPSMLSTAASGLSATRFALQLPLAVLAATCCAAGRPKKRAVPESKWQPREVHVCAAPPATECASNTTTFWGRGGRHNGDTR